MKFIVKLLLNGIFVIPFLVYFSEANWFQATITSVMLSVIAFFIGDQLILRGTNNIFATVSDAVIAYVYLWVVSIFMNWTLSYGELLTIAIIVGVVEFIYHRYLGVDD